MSQTHVELEDPTLIDAVSVLVCGTTIATLVVVSVVTIAYRKVGSIKLLGGTMPLCCLSAAVAILAVLITNGYLGGHYATLLRTAVCQLWDYYITIPAQAIFFGSIASACLGSRLARILFVSSVRMGISNSRSGDTEGDVNHEGSSAADFSVYPEWYAKARPVKNVTVFKDPNDMLVINSTVANAHLKDVILFDESNGNQGLYVITGSSDDDDGEDQLQDAPVCDASPEEDGCTFTEEMEVLDTRGGDGDTDDEEHSERLIDRKEEEAEDEAPYEVELVSSATGTLKSDPCVSKANEHRMDLLGLAIFIRPGFLVKKILTILENGSASRNTKLAQAALWVVVITLALGLCLLSVVPGATSWDADAHSCYSEVWIKVLVICSLVFIFLMAAATVAGSKLMVRSDEQTSMTTIMRICKRHFAVPLYAERAQAESSADDASTVGEAPSRGVLARARSLVVRSVGFVARLFLNTACLFMCSMAAGCTSLVRVRVVDTWSLMDDQKSASVARSMTDTVLTRSREVLYTCAYFCVSASSPGRATITISSDGTPYLRPTGHSVHDYYVGAQNYSITGHMKVRHGHALVLFALSLLILVPLNVSGYVSTSAGRFLYMTTMCATYIGCIYLIEGVVLVDVLFNKGVRFRDGMLIAKDHEIIPDTISSAWRKNQFIIIGEFLNYVTRKHADTVYRTVGVTKKNQTMLGLTALETGQQAPSRSTNEGVLFVDKMIILAASNINSNSACSIDALSGVSSATSFPGIGEPDAPLAQLKRLRKWLIDPLKVNESDQNVRRETVDLARYRLPCFDRVVCSIFPDAEFVSSPSVDEDQTMETISKVALVILGCLFWDEYRTYCHRKREFMDMESGMSTAAATREYS